MPHRREPRTPTGPGASRSEKLRRPLSRCDPPGAPGSVEVCVYRDQNLVVERISGTPQYLIPYLAQWLHFSIDITLGVRQVTYQA